MAKVTSDKGKIIRRIKAGSKAATIAVTEQVIQYGNDYVRVDQGTMRDSALISSRPEDGLAVWDTPYAKKVYFTGEPSKDVNPNASLMWAQKGVDTHRKELQIVAQNAFTKGMGD